MATGLDTVNFEDLFDFSPEPLDSAADEGEAELGQGAGILGNVGYSHLDRQQDFYSNRSTAIQQPQQQQQQHQQPTTLVQLSASLPVSYGENFEVRASDQPQRNKRGRKPGQRFVRADMKTKLERSRQSARECRARKKLRYQYLDDLLLEREKANLKLKDELLTYQKWCHELDKGRIPDGLNEMLRKYAEEKNAPGNE